MSYFIAYTLARVCVHLRMRRACMCMRVFRHPAVAVAAAAAAPAKVTAAVL